MQLTLLLETNQQVHITDYIHPIRNHHLLLDEAISDDLEKSRHPRESGDPENA
jgi:hypothetical protein